MEKLTSEAFIGFVFYHLEKQGCDELTSHRLLKKYKLKEKIAADRRVMHYPPKFYADEMINSKDGNYTEVQDLLL